MGSEMEETFCSNNKGKMCFWWGVFIINCISAYKLQMTFMGLDFEADKLRIKTELRVMMAEL